jgi:seryl-tRNA synthetase
MRTFVDLHVPLPDELLEELLKRLPYVSQGIQNFRILPGGNRAAFDLTPQFQGRGEVIAAQINEVAHKLCAGYRPGALRTLASQTTLPSSFQGDPHSLLSDMGEIKMFGRGRYGFGPKLVGLMEYFDSQIRRMATQFRAEPRAFPSLIGAEVLDRCRYLKNFPASLNLVSHLREDHNVLQEFAHSARTEGDHLVCDSSSLSEIECLLSPSICFHCYAWLRDSHLSKPSAITALGKCFRYESSNLTGLERLWDFTMREVIFIGPAEYVLENRRVLLDQSIEFLDELGLAYEITTATDPFFVDTYAVQAAYQQGFELKFELLAPLPYNGKKLAVGSINYHQDFFGRTFDLRTTEDAAHTGCIGFGYERLALAFLAQHGVNEKEWPRAVVKGIDDVHTAR